MGGYRLAKNNLNSKNIVNYWKLVDIPLIISIISLMIIVSINIRVNKNLLIKQMETDGIVLANENIVKIRENQESIEIIEKLLEDKLKIVAQIVIDNRSEINTQFLIRISKNLGVDQISWYSNTGELLYSTCPKDIGWKPFKGHPLYNFMHCANKELIEDIREDAITGEWFKYGAKKTEDGYLIQVGILAENIDKFTQTYGCQSIVNRLSNEENIFYARIIDKNFIIIANNKEDNIGLIVDDKDREIIGEALNGQSSTNQVSNKNTGEKILNIAVPIKLDNEINHVLLLGLSMETVYSLINLNRVISIGIGIIIFLFYLWIQYKNIVNPARQLNNYISQIDMEKNISYRIKVKKNDTFEGLSISINNILNNAHNYFVELTAINEQLKSSEEALQIQFNGIQDYTEKLEDLKQKYEISIKGTNSAVWEYNLEDDKLYISDTLRDVLGREFVNDDYVDKVLNSLLSKEDRDKVISEFIEYINQNKPEIDLHININDKMDRERLFLIKGTGIFNKDKGLKSINGILYDITHIKEQRKQIEHMAYHDALTGLPNRRSFMKIMQEEIDKKRKCFVILLDIDDFKGINDIEGHQFGDKILQEIAKGLKETFDKNTTVFRFGGDEFLIVFRGDNIEEIVVYIEEIRRIFIEDTIIDNHTVYLTFSIGITRYPEDGNDINQLMINVDTAMYVVKNKGKNNYLFFNEKMIEMLKVKKQIEKTLREALKEDKFVLVYQPQVSVQTREVIGFEALLRLKEHKISPAEFIPIAEETGMILDIGRWVTKNAIKQMKIWKNKGLELKPIGINFSSIQLEDKEYLEFLKTTLDEYDIDPKYLEIEITEGIFLEKTEETIRYLHKLKEIGVNIALDDFGTGYSSLSYLTYIPIDKVKLDKSLNEKFLLLESSKVMDSIVSIIHSLGFNITAEGIEDMEQYRKLKIVGCDYIQGYLFSKPLSVEEVEKIYNHMF